MAGVFREMTIEWEGKKYDFTPSNKFLRRIDREVSINKIAERAAQGDAPIFDIAFVVAEILREAGADTSEDEVLAIVTDASEGDRAEYLVSLIGDLMPQPKQDDAQIVSGAAPKKTKGKK